MLRSSSGPRPGTPARGPTCTRRPSASGTWSGRRGTGTSPPYSIIGVGGSPHTPLGFLTGHTTERLGCEGFLKTDLSPADRAAKLDEIRDKLVAAQKAGKLIVGGTADIGGPQVKVPGLYYNHSYAVLNYGRATDTVTFWNPMGNRFTPKGPPGLADGYQRRAAGSTLR